MEEIDYTFIVNVKDLMLNGGFYEFKTEELDDLDLILVECNGFY